VLSHMPPDESVPSVGHAPLKELQALRLRQQRQQACWSLAIFMVGYIAGRLRDKGCGDAAPQPLTDVAYEVRSALYAPPKRLGAVAVPSVVPDARGAVHNLQVGGFRFNVLVSEAGTLRSGDVHKADQLDMVFEGRVRVRTREYGRDVDREYSAGQLIIIPANVPHIFTSVTRSVMAEWWRSGEFETRYYQPYRRVVDAALKELRYAAHARNKSTLNASRRTRRQQKAHQEMVEESSTT